MGNVAKRKSFDKRHVVISRLGVPLFIFIVFLVLTLTSSILLNVKFIYSGSPILAHQLDGILYPPLSPTLSPTVCKYHDNPEKSSYLTSYTVQSGDSLLSIARDKLCDPSRVTELINLNHDTYPRLSLNYPYLEVGWKLYLPPHNFPPSSGNLSEIRGVITTASYGFWDVQVDDYQGAAAARLFNIAMGKFISKPRNQYRVGDCVTVILDIVNHVGQPLLIMPQ